MRIILEFSSFLTKGVRHRGDIMHMAFLPDYNFPDAGEEGAMTGTTLAGILGGVFTFLLAGITVLIISIVKKKRNSQHNYN